MTIQPSLVLDEKDLKPFIDEYKKVMKVKDDARFEISTIIPVTPYTKSEGKKGDWTIEIRGQFI